MAAPIEVFFWLTPNCWKVTVALEEMGLPYVLRPVAIGKGEQFSPEFLAIAPNNRVPAIVDPEGHGGRAPVSVFESGAILQYLGRKTNRYYPADEPRRAAVEQWLYWQMAGVGPMFGQAVFFRNYAPGLVDDTAGLAFPTRRYADEVDRLLGVLDRRLADRAFVVDDYSIADMALYPWVALATRVLDLDLGGFGHVGDWLARMAARPGVQRGMAAGGELGPASPAPGSAEQQTFRQVLFGQTAETVAAAASRTGPAGSATA